MSWLDAQKTCLQQWRVLLEPRSQQKFDDAFAFKDLVATEIWLGASDLAEEGKFVWASDCEEVGDDNPFWLAGEPNDAGNREDCLALANWAIGMVDLPCDGDHMHAFVCDAQ